MDASGPESEATSLHRLLDVGFSLGAGLMFLAAVVRLYKLPSYTWSELVGSGVGLAGLVLLVALWVAARRERASIGHIFGIGLLVIVVTLAVDAGPSVLPLLLVSVTFAALRRGWRLALLMAVLQVLIIFAWAAREVGWSHAFGEVVALCLVQAFALSFGMLLSEVDNARSRAARSAKELSEANRKLRLAMTAERDLVLARERSRAAAEMHDGLGSRMTVIGMSLSFALRTRNQDSERAWEEVASAHQMNAQALGQMRQWVRALSPPDLIPDVGGAGAFDAIAESFRGTGMDVLVQHRGDAAPLCHEVSVFAQRMVQECLTNTLRHSGARKVCIDLIQGADAVRISVVEGGEIGEEIHRDDLIPASEGFGLRSLRERAEVLGGGLAAGTRKGGDFCVVATCPIRIDASTHTEGDL